MFLLFGLTLAFLCCHCKDQNIEKLKTNANSWLFHLLGPEGVSRLTLNCLRYYGSWKYRKWSGHQIEQSPLRVVPGRDDTTAELSWFFRNACCASWRLQIQQHGHLQGVRGATRQSEDPPVDGHEMDRDRGFVVSSDGSHRRTQQEIQPQWWYVGRRCDTWLCFRLWFKKSLEQWSNCGWNLVVLNKFGDAIISKFNDWFILAHAHV